VWFDPRTGRRTLVQSSAQNVFQAPDQQDWVLLLKDK
jgi:Putative collagen-binding domain of a collagenase